MASRGPRGPLRKIVLTEAAEGYDGVYREHLSCGHVRTAFSEDPSPRTNRRHCKDCRDGTDTRTRRAMALGERSR